MKTLVIAALVTVVSAASARSDGPSYPLPDDLVAHFSSGDFAERFWVDGMSGGDVVRCGVRFDNDGGQGSVTLRWTYRTQDTSGRTLTDLHTTPYLPTAVAQRAGTTDTFYVAGWYERSRMAVIEEWTITNAAVGTSIPEGGGHPIPTMTSPAIVKRLVVSTLGEQARPIESIAVDPFEDVLYAIEYGPEARMSRLDLTLGSDPHTLEPFAAATALGGEVELVPALADTRSMKVGYHAQEGLVVVLRPAAPWAGKYTLECAVMYDIDGDGVLDHTSIVPMSREEYLAKFPYDWIEGYT